MEPFPRIVLNLYCSSSNHDIYMLHDLKLPDGIWKGPREINCIKRGKSGKKYLFNNSMAPDNHRDCLELLLHAAISSLEPYRSSILPNSIGQPKSSSIVVILPQERIHVSFDPLLLAHISSLGLTLQLDFRHAIPPTQQEIEEENVIAQKLGISGLLDTPDDW